ncbi:MAG: FAD-dependent oxidoreductase [Gammaproteobacteria bacterium]
MSEPSMETRDLVVVGSGAGALTAAVTAAHAGLDVLLVEKAAYFGGTSALSGGVAWLPLNPHVPAGGEQDSRERALRYLGNVIGQERYRPAVVEAFVDHARAMVEFLEACTEVRFEATTYPDYKAHLDGGMPVGRSIAAREFDGRRLGPWFARLQPPMKELCALGAMMVDGMDVWHMMNATRSFASLRHCARRLAGYAVDRLSHPRGTRLTMGNALMGRLLKSAVDAGVTLWHASPAVRLSSEAGRIAAVTVRRAGGEVTVQVRRGVILGSGGFAHDADLKHRLIPFADVHQTICPETVAGDGIRMGLDCGAALGGNTWHNFLGTQVTIMHAPDGSVVSKAPFLRRDRAKPGYVLVNRMGRRFVSESWPYNDVAYAMNDAEGAVPAFLVCDHVRLRRYGLGLVRPGPEWARPLGSFLASGHLVRAATVRELAVKLGVDADGLEQTVRRNNEYARTGRDPEFGKGDTVYDRWQGDPEVKPNPNLGPIETGPFYAVTQWPGNLGTFCGLVTDGRARVLDAGGQPIPGLYACGCDMHPVFSGCYPGGGGSIGPGMTFGFLAARDVAGQGGA